MHINANVDNQCATFTLNIAKSESVFVGMCGEVLLVGSQPAEQTYLMFIICIIWKREHINTLVMRTI